MAQVLRVAPQADDTQGGDAVVQSSGAPAECQDTDHGHWYVGIFLDNKKSLPGIGRRYTTVP